MLQLVERIVPASRRGGMIEDERRTYELVLTVLPDNATLHALCIAPWLVNVVKRYTHYVPFVPSLWRSDLSASSREPVSADQGGLESQDPSGISASYAGQPVESAYATASRVMGKPARPF